MCGLACNDILNRPVRTTAHNPMAFEAVSEIAAFRLMLRLDRDALDITDRIEGYDPGRDRCLYVREEVVVRFEDGQEAVAWTYLFANSVSGTDCPRLVVGELNGVPLYAWPRLEPSPEKRKREMS